MRGLYERPNQPSEMSEIVRNVRSGTPGERPKCPKTLKGSDIRTASGRSGVRTL